MMEKHMTNSTPVIKDIAPRRSFFGHLGGAVCRVVGRLSGTFLRIRSNVGAEIAALAASHSRAEGRHRDIIRSSVDVDLDLVAAGQACYEQTAHAEAAHVAERHWADRIVRAGHCRGILSPDAVQESLGLTP